MGIYILINRGIIEWGYLLNSKLIIKKFGLHTIKYLCIISTIIAGVREYKIHERGMIHQTLYNTGTIGRPWIVNAGTTLPLMEWPPRSRTVINGVEYDGHHNIYGAGVYISANEQGSPGMENRIYSFCGGIGTNSTTELPYGRWSFPISIEKIENFPLLPDGELNPNYNPDDAEEIIIAKWATNSGITVTRTSRTWSYPDFDDMIIYEYELEYTGDTDGNPATIEKTTPLVDVLFHFNYGFGPTQLAYFRWYGDWRYGDPGGIYRADLRYSFDPDYWLLWNTNTHTTFSDQGVEKFAAKPEPDKDLFLEFATTGLNGGGLLGAACPGYAMLYWDTNHLAIVDPVDEERNQSDYEYYMLKTGGGAYFETDENDHILQPWNMKCQSPNTRESKMIDRPCTMDERWWTVYGEQGVQSGYPSDGGRYVLPNHPETGEARTWKGRARFEWDETYNGGGANQGFGPYVLEIGEKLEFAMAEVVGYGGTAGKMALGGQRNSQFYAIRDWNRPVELDGEILTENYLDDFGYPDHINSDVITVNQVAHKAFEAYLGENIEFDSTRMGPVGGMIFPEDNPRPSDNISKYKINVPAPAPIISVKNTPSATVKILWNRNAESFVHPRLIGNIEEYFIFKADNASGPWTILDTILVGDVNGDNLYEYEDTDQNFKLGETKYFSVTSVMDDKIQSGKTNITSHTKNISSVETMGKVYAVPNPFISNSGFAGVGQENAIGFYGLPEQCTIKIYSYSGQLIETIEHDENVFSTPWFQVSRNNQDIASGTYYYYVTTEKYTDNGESSYGKMVIIK